MHPPFLNEVVAKGTFLLKVPPPINAVVHAIPFKQEAPKKQQEDGLVTKCSRHLLLYCITKHTTKEALQNH